MDKLKMHTPDGVNANIERIAELFPTCVTESRDDKGNVTRAIDFDLLRQELSDRIVEGPQERYRLDWPGKRKALLDANAPIAKTLRPCREESVDFDTTRNLFIEGDNLDALKLLQETYLGKVKMIYIDPPYNTGKDFIYEDDFAEAVEQYLERSNQQDDSGRLIANTDANGRFHSDWLSMIYTRARLARDLLADDGILFASIDDSESANLKRILDEVFGEENFIDTLAVEMSTTSGPKTVNAQQGTIVKNTEFAHVYRKSAAFDKLPHQPLFDGVESYDTHYSQWMNEDGTLGALADRLLADAQIGHDIRQFGLLERQGFSLANIDKLLYISQSAKTFIESNLDRIASLDRPPVSAAGQNPVIGRWETFETDHRKYILTTLANGRLRALMPLSLNFRQSDDYKSRFGRTVIRGDLWKGFHQDMGNVAKEGGIAFSNGKKPVRLIKQLIRWANNTQDGIILDFFAGSATTAHAVMLATVDDGVNRRYIMVQLDEVPDPASTPEGNSFKTIAALGEERIRRAAAQIKADNAGKPGIDKLDVGFRVLKIDTSNMAEVYYKPDELKQEQLLGQVDNVKPDRTAEDLLFQVLLDWGVDLSLPIVRETIDGREVFFVDGNALAACFAADGSVDEPFVTELAKRKPLRVVFRDAGFASDNARINVEQIFKTLSPDTEVRTL